MKKISIVIPCYNSEKYIHRCIKSLLNQTIGLEDLQLIFVDDASTDNTLSILYEYEKEYSYSITVIACEKNGRQGTARNIGMKYAECDYIGFVDSDDWIDRTMYEKLYQKAIKFDCDMVACDFVRVVDENNIPKIKRGDDKIIDINNIEDRKQLIHYGLGYGGVMTKIYKRKLIFDNKLFFPELITYEDNYWGAVMSFLIKRIYYLNEVLYYYYANMSSTLLTRNSKHHFDRLEIELMKISYYKRNRLFEIYKDEIEFAFIKGYYINSLFIFLTKFDITPMDTIEEMQDTLLKFFPQYYNNKYLGELKRGSEFLLRTVKKS